MQLQMILKCKGMVKGKPVLCYICIGFILICCIRDYICGRSVLELPEVLNQVMEEEVVTIQGEVYGLEEKDYGQVIYVQSDSYKWMIYDYSFQELSLGNTIGATGSLVLFSQERNWGNFDALTYYNTMGIVAAISSEEVWMIDEEVYSIRNSLYQFRLQGISRIYEVLGEEEGCFLVAMIFGEKNDMDAEQEELYQKIGISHIFAISGLHISLLSLVVYQMIRRVSGSYWLAGIISSIFLGLYILMVGMGISALRAGIMFLIRVGGDITGRVYDIRTSLGIAALCILIPNFAYIYYSGFLLSFGAILGVIYLIPFWQEVLEQWSVRRGLREYKVVNWAIQGIGATLGIQWMILPIILYTYYEVSPYSIVINLLVIPLMTVLLGVALIGLTLSLVWYGLGALLLSLSGWFLQVINWLGESFLAMPYSRIVVGQPWKFMIVLYYVGIIGGLCYIHISKRVDLDEKMVRRIRTKVGILFFFLPILLTIHLPEGDLLITMIDIGQGDCIYIQGPEGVDYLVDGGSTDISNVGKYRIESYLRSIGVDSIEYVFISHGDTDHLNGIEEMLARQDLGVRIETVVVCEEIFQDENIQELVEIAQEYGTQVAIIEAGDQVIEGEMILTCLAPLATYTGDIGNASSMILDLNYGEFQMLFTGDVEGEGEEELIEILYDYIEETGNTYDVLKVAHHGSRNSTPTEFLELVQPTIAFISAGVDSIYGHPHEELLSRLDEADCIMYITAENGGVNLSYNVNDDSIVINTTITSSE